MRTLNNILSLGAPDRRLVLTAAIWLVAVRVGLWVVRLPTLQRALACFSHSRIGSRDHARAVDAERIAWAVQAASRRIPRATCLVQALATQALLARGGIASELRLGVAFGEQRHLEAHAWVESEGKVLIGGGALEQFTPLARFKR